MIFQLSCRHQLLACVKSKHHLLRLRQSAAACIQSQQTGRQRRRQLSLHKRSVSLIPPPVWQSARLTHFLTQHAASPKKPRAAGGATPPHAARAQQKARLKLLTHCWTQEHSFRSGAYESMRVTRSRGGLCQQKKKREVLTGPGKHHAQNRKTAVQQLHRRSCHTSLLGRAKTRFSHHQNTAAAVKKRPI